MHLIYFFFVKRIVWCATYNNWKCVIEENVVTCEDAFHLIFLDSTFMQKKLVDMSNILCG
jgi:hypothetical protein